MYKRQGQNRNPARLVPGGIFALCFLLLLCYTLFFALPFEETYVRESRGRRVCRTGMYALCRHPGVLWYAGFYFSLYAALGGTPLLVLAVTGTVLDLLYAVFQDVWTFPKTFCDYEEYRRAVSYTHLDVYKRQRQIGRTPAKLPSAARPE